MITVSFPFGTIRLEEIKPNESIYFVMADCSQAVVSDANLTVTKVKGDLRVWSGGDKCSGQIRVTLHDASKNDNTEYSIDFERDFFQRLITSGPIDDQQMCVLQSERSGGYGSPTVYTMEMELSCYGGRAGERFDEEEE